MKISACVITKNEEKNIARSILSYKDIVDEIIVVDSDSTDNTVKIAESLGAKVFTRPWTNDFAAARNDAIDKATGDWIIIMDADEYFEEDCWQKVRHEIENADKSGVDTILSDMYQTDRNGVECNGITLTQRIFRNSPEIRYKGKIHEHLVKCTGAMKTVKTNAFKIYHTGYDKSIVKTKSERNLQYLLDDSLDMEKHLLHYYRAEGYHVLGEYESCIREIRLLQKLPEFDGVLYQDQNMFKTYVYKISAMLQLKDSYQKELILKEVNEARGRFEKHPEIKLMEAIYYMDYNHVDEAINAFEDAIKLHDHYNGVYDNSFSYDISSKFRTVAVLYKKKNDMAKALAYITEAVKHDREKPENLLEFFSILRCFHTDDRMKTLEQLFNAEEPADIIGIMAASWHAGITDVFTMYFLKYLKQWPDQIAKDENMLCKIYLLQKNDAGIEEIADRHTQEEEFKKYAFIAGFREGREDVSESCDFALEVICELLRAADDESANSLLEKLMAHTASSFTTVDERIGLAETFKAFNRWDQACKLYLSAVELAEGGQKGECYLAAAHMVYYLGDFDRMKAVLEEAKPLISTENHFPAQLRKWAEESRT